jgi:ArsR family transcriptional regulator
MYRLPFADATFDLAVMQMVLHYAEDPSGALAEVARVLRPAGRLIVIDLAQHRREELRSRLAHRWPGFGEEAMRVLLTGAGMQPGVPVSIDGPLAIRLWPATVGAPAPAEQSRELVG